MNQLSTEDDVGPARFAGFTVLVCLCGLLMVGCCRTTAPSAALGPESCRALHWLEFARSDGIRLININLSPPRAGHGEMSALRDALLLLGPEAKGSQPAGYRDRLDSTSAQSKDLLETAVTAKVHELLPDAKVTVMPLVSEDGILIDRRMPPSSLTPPVVVEFERLKTRGDVSAIVASAYGEHVFVVLEIVPGHWASEDEVKRRCHAP